MTHETEPLHRAVQRTIDAMDERRTDSGAWLPDTEDKAWHYMAGILTAFLPRELADELVETVQMLVSKADDRKSEAPEDAWRGQALLDQSPSPSPFVAVGLVMYDADEDELVVTAYDRYVHECEDNGTDAFGFHHWVVQGKPEGPLG